MKFETRRQQLASPDVFRRRLVRSFAVGSLMVAVSLAVGMVGYGVTESLTPLDAFLNASMILSGMGPLHNPKTDAGKLFAGIYALYSGFAVLVIAGVTFAPAIHRVLHRFHLADDKDEENEEASDKKREGKRAKATRK
ncbi:MAG TPA: hypothetical protein VHP62_05890 [Usitatibacter sp.]|jgi:hypothetical protein|nr:hypothetical protein [Usitatibacter sp.]